MKLNKKIFFLTIPILLMQTSINNKRILINSVNNYKEEKISLTSIFLKDRLDNDIYTGTAENLTKITDTDIREAINKEILEELSFKTNVDSLTPILDYDVIITTLDKDKPLPNIINLSVPLNVKIAIIAKTNSKIIKDKIILKSTISYPIFKFDNFLQEGLIEIYKITHPGEATELGYPSDFKKNYNQSIYKIKNIGQPTLNKNISTFNYFGESLFENNSDQDQTYPTVPETEEVTNETSVSLSEGIDTGVGFQFNFFNSHLNVEFNKQETVSNKTSKTITAPSVPTVVKPHQKMQVLVFLNGFISSQKVSIDSDISGFASITLNFKSGWKTDFTLNVVDIVKYYQDVQSCPIGVSINSNNKNIHLVDEAKVMKYETGTFWHVITNPIN